MEIVELKLQFAGEKKFILTKDSFGPQFGPHNSQFENSLSKVNDAKYRIMTYRNTVDGS